MTDTIPPDINGKSKEDAKVETKEGPNDSASVPPSNLNIDASSSDESAEEASPPTLKERVIKLWWEYEFLFLVIVAIGLARAYPPLGAEFVAPEITATWVAVMLIFILAGMGLKTEELSKSSRRVGFNFSVQSFNFFLISPVVFGVTRGLAEVGAVPQALADGMVICSCLAMSVNMVLVLTAKSGGDEAAAIFNAAFGNLVGVFLSPPLILGYLGVSSDINLWQVFYKLVLRIPLPVIVGQLLQRYPPIAAFAKGHKFLLKQAQQYLLIFIIYTVFCSTFSNEGSILTLGEVFVAIAVQFCLMCTFMVISWGTFKFLYPDEPTLRVMALFGSTHKSLATGIPLIKSMYDGDPLIAVYTLPILIWHPMQLVVGSFFVPRLVKWIEREQVRLATHDVTPDDSVDEESPHPDSNTTGAEDIAATRNST